MKSRNSRWMVAVAAVALMAIGLVRHETRGSKPPAAPRPVAADAGDRLQQVERVVAERNAKEGRSEKAFVDAGWTMVSAPAPDPRITELDPTLIAAGREKELRDQLASTVPSPRHAHRIAQIVLTAQDPATRESAVDALARIRTPEARSELLDLLSGGKLAPDDLGRRQLAAVIHPVDLDDEIAAKMAGLLDNRNLTPVEKQQLAFNLALAGLRDGMTLPDHVLDSMSPEARALVARMTDLGKRAFIAHGDDHDRHSDQKD